MLLYNYIPISFLCSNYTLNTSYLYNLLLFLTNLLQNNNDLYLSCFKLLFIESKTISPNLNNIKEWFKEYLNFNINNYTSICLVNYIRIYRPFKSSYSNYNRNNNNLNNNNSNNNTNNLNSNSNSNSNSTNYNDLDDNIEQVISENDIFIKLLSLRLLIIPPINYMNKKQWCEKVDEQMILYKENTQTHQTLSEILYNFRRSIQIFPTQNNNYLDENYEDISESMFISQRSILSPNNTGVSQRLRSFPESVYPFSNDDIPLTPIHLTADNEPINPIPYRRESWT